MMEMDAKEEGEVKTRDNKEREREGRHRLQRNCLS